MALAAALFAAVITFGTAAPAAAEDATPLDMSSPANLQHQMSFRKALGFESSEAFVKDINENPKKFAALRHGQTFGLTVTPEEAEELATRSAMQDSIPALEKAAKELSGDDFGGIYTDHLAGGLVKVGLPRQFHSELPNLARSMPFPERVAVFETQFGYSELQDLAGKLTQSAVAQDTSNQITGVSVEISKNRIHVGSIAPSSELQQKLIADFGGSVEVVKGYRAQTTAWFPAPRDLGRYDVIRDIRGGLAIVFSPNGASGSCSTALMAYRGADRFILTAGHCDNSSNTARYQGRHADEVFRFFGHRSANLFAPGNRVDAQAIKVNPGTVWRDDVYLYPSRTLIDVSSWQASAGDDHPGDFVCSSGQINPGSNNVSNCGIMTRKDFAPSYWPGQFMAPTFRCATYNTYMGDSGGAVYREYTSGIHALGIQSGYGCGLYGDETIYSHIGMAAVDLGGFPIVT